MVHVGLDLSRTRLDVHVMDESGAPLAVTTALPEAGGLAALVSRIGAEFGGPVYAAIESMNGARFVHDQLELAGWQVEIADAQKVKGLAPLACKTGGPFVFRTVVHHNIYAACCRLIHSSWTSRGVR